MLMTDLDWNMLVVIPYVSDESSSSRTMGPEGGALLPDVLMTELEWWYLYFAIDKGSENSSSS